MTSSNHHPFAGRWIARINTSITACGGSPDQVYRIARAARFKEIPLISYIPLDDPMNFPQVFFEIQQILQNESGVYLVGGAVRDALIGLPIHDLDFVCLGKTKTIARNVANGLTGAFYTMDETRQIFRVLLDNDGGKLVLDFAAIRGYSLEEDQINRDFSVNAIAVDLQDPQKLLDPTGGAQAIISKKLVMCSPSSFTDDPIRIIRGIRLAAQFNFTFESETRTAMKSAVTGLSETTIERIRDELFKIVELSDSEKALKALIWLGCDRFVIPVLNNWQHPEKRSQLDNGYLALSALHKNLHGVVMKPSHPVSQDVLTAMILNGLSGYREFLWNWFDMPVHPERSRLSVFAVGLLHLPAHLSDQGSRIPFLTAEKYHLSNVESSYLQNMSNAVIQLHDWTNRKTNVSKRSQYKYYKEFGYFRC